MKSTSAGLAAHIVQTVTTLALCIVITRADGTVFRWTTHDRDLPIGADTYLAMPGFDTSAVQSRDAMQVDNAEVSAFFHEAGITAEDVDAGDWDHAAVRMFTVNWADTTMGELKGVRGWLGEVTTHSAIMLELRGLAAALNTRIGELVTPGCPHTLGDALCGVDLTDYTAALTVTAAADDREFSTDLATATVALTPTTTGTPPLDYFAGGVLTWLTGANAGRREVVKTNAADGTLELQLPMVGTIAPGDTASVSAGCGKTRVADCYTRFDNVVSFLGYDLLPGTDVLLKWGGQ